MIKSTHEAMELGGKIERLCQSLGINKWFITSAKSDENINDGMMYLLGLLMEHHKKEQEAQESVAAKESKGGAKLPQTETADNTLVSCLTEVVTKLASFTHPLTDTIHFPRPGFVFGGPG